MKTINLDDDLYKELETIKIDKQLPTVVDVIKDFLKAEKKNNNEEEEPEQETPLIGNIKNIILYKIRTHGHVDLIDVVGEVSKTFEMPDTNAETLVSRTIGLMSDIEEVEPGRYAVKPNNN